MSLLTKLERLERMASFRHDVEVSAELVEDLSRMLRETQAWPQLPIQERILRLREWIKNYEAETDHESLTHMVADLKRKELAQLETEAAKLQ